MKSIRVATCQFSVEGRIDHNRKWMLKQVAQAAEQQADVVHFSECALSGYAGVDISGISDLNWDELTAATQDVMAAARTHKLWILIGSTHRLDDHHKPHNCVYVVNPKGQIHDRYDKRFCTGGAGKQPTLDLCHYTPGNRNVTFKVNGITCGVAICYDYRFPELYRAYQQQGVNVMFQSFHNARKTVAVDPKYNIWKTIVPATMQCRAAENHFWVSANNSTARRTVTIDLWGKPAEVYANANLSIYSAQTCNARCAFCVEELRPAARGVSLATQKVVERDDTRYFTALRDVLNALKPLNPSMSVTGGEPSQDARLPRILRTLQAAYAQGARKRTVTTNGSGLLDQRDGRRVIDWIADTGVAHLNISRAHWDDRVNARLMRYRSDASPDAAALREIVACAKLGGTRVRLLKGAPGADNGIHGHKGREYTLVLRGGFTDETGSYGPGNALVVYEAFKVYGNQMHVVQAFMKVLPKDTKRGWGKTLRGTE